MSMTDWQWALGGAMKKNVLILCGENRLEVRIYSFPQRELVVLREPRPDYVWSASIAVIIFETACGSMDGKEKDRDIAVTAIVSGAKKYQAVLYEGYELPSLWKTRNRRLDLGFLDGWYFDKDVAASRPQETVFLQDSQDFVLALFEKNGVDEQSEQFAHEVRKLILIPEGNDFTLWVEKFGLEKNYLGGFYK